MLDLNLQNLIDASVHFGHESQRWNPKMRPFVYKERQGIHIINLQKTLIQTRKAMDFLRSVTAKGGRVIFVGTKFQAHSAIETAAKESQQFYVTKRWLGGTLTNFQTIKVSIDRMKAIEQMKERFDLDRYSKKERSRIEKEYHRLEENLKGVKDLKDTPAAIFLTDLRKEKIAFAEAQRLHIPVVAIVDTNCDPSFVDYPIPGNDDSARSIGLFAGLAAQACKEGLKEWQSHRRKEQDLQGKTTAKGPKDSYSQTSDGPTVVTLNRSRKLVAAGTAEDVEIELELDKEADSKKTSSLEGKKSEEKADDSKKNSPHKSQQDKKANSKN